MKQIVQNPKSGKLELAEVPSPASVPGQVVVRNCFSVVSPGTEKMALDFARKSLLGKARSRPDLVQQVLRKLRQEGPVPTYQTVMNRLDAPQPLGYSSAGIVESVGAGVSRFGPGDRVACAGAGYANHAEWVSVPENLVAHVPDALPLEKAAFATLGAIALQGLRVASPQLGEIAAVIGLGLIGQLAVNLLRANGCRVLGIDLDEERIKQARILGAEWGGRPDDAPARWLGGASEGAGADFALVTAASESSAPILLGAELCRARGRVVVVGATAMELDRRSFYEKELELRMSMSYGPGRYDRRYEEDGLDYPIAYVRWTENRNLQAFLALAASGGIDPALLDTQTLPFSDALDAYEELASGERRSLAVVFRYDEAAKSGPVVQLRETRDAGPTAVGVAFVGAGNYAKSVLLPAVAAAPDHEPLHICTTTGPGARQAAVKFGYANCGTQPDAVFADPAVDLAFIATRHDSHSELAARALRAGKSVWLEKPAALHRAELLDLLDAAQDSHSLLAIGFNRRFSAHTRAIREALADRGPLAIHYTVAAGPPPAESWLLDPRSGGGRIVGEACHFVDLCSYLAGGIPDRVFARRLSRDAEQDDSTLAMLGFTDGSTATLEYLANAEPGLPKERFEASAGGLTARCENFRTTRLPGGKRFKTVNQDKGQRSAVAAVIQAVRTGEASPWSPEEIFAVTEATFAIERSIRTGAAEIIPTLARAATQPRDERQEGSGNEH